MATDRARADLGWRPAHSAEDAVGAFLSRAEQRAVSDMPPLHR
jgi:nucleoside-diphosphate-sugar epimerase